MKKKPLAGKQDVEKKKHRMRLEADEANTASRTTYKYNNALRRPAGSTEAEEPLSPTIRYDTIPTIIKASCQLHSYGNRNNIVIRCRADRGWVRHQFIVQK